MKVQTINILTNNSMAKNIKNDSEEDENNFETNQVGFFKRSCLKICPKNHGILVNYFQEDPKNMWNKAMNKIQSVVSLSNLIPRFVIFPLLITH